MKKILLMSVLMLFVGYLMCSNVLAGEFLVSDFNDADMTGFTKAGDSNYINDYILSVQKVDNSNPFALRLSQKVKNGWFGVQIPDVNKYPISNITGFSYDARNIGNVSEMAFDLNLKDGSRWICVTKLPDDGAFATFNLSAPSFFPTVNPNNLSKPDFSNISHIWITLRNQESWYKNKALTPAEAEIDNLKIICDNNGANSVNSNLKINKLTSLKGVNVILVNTNSLSLYGQTVGSTKKINEALIKAGANVKVVESKNLSKVISRDVVIVWEGPVCNKGDFEAVQNLLKKGNKLVWFGVDTPFSRTLNAKGDGLLPNTTDGYKTNDYKLTKGFFHNLNPYENTNKLKLTELGKSVLKEFPSELDSVKANYMTVNDSLYLEQNFPWVDFESLLTVDYNSRNWVFLDRPFIGSLISMFTHHAGEYAGSRMIFASMSTSGNSIFNPNSGVFDYLITSLVKKASEKVKVDSSIAKIKEMPFKVTRENFFHNDQKIMGGLNFGSVDFSDPDNVYAVRRMGYNCMLIGIPWLNEKNKEGYYIDWEKTDKIIKEAEKINFGIIFDPYPFGWDRFAWSTMHDGKRAGYASVYNKTFRDTFAEQMVALVKRYKNSPSLVAVFATPDTSQTCFTYPDDSEVTKDAWKEFAKEHNLKDTLPSKPAKSGGLALTPENEMYIDFWYEHMDDFISKTIDGVRSVTPEMPILLRGGYLDAAQSFKFASNYKNIGPYCECIETSIDVENYYRGLSITYNTTIGGENGWPKERKAPLRMAMANLLLGGYKYYLFSFESVPFAKPGTLEFEDLSKVWGNVINAKRIEGNTAILLPDSTLWTSFNLGFLEVEGRPNNGYLMERLGIPYGAVSAYFLDNIDNLKVIVDTGCNDVFTAPSREKLINWIKNGGTLVGYSFTGRFDMSGKDISLAKELGLTFEPGEYSVGKGKVIILSKVPSVDADANMLIDAIKAGNGKTEIVTDKPINSTAYTKGNSVYYAFFNKSKDQVGSFFSEQNIEYVEKNILKDVILTIDVPKGKTKAIELCTGKVLKIENGKVKLTIPKTYYRLIKFD